MFPVLCIFITGSNSQEWKPCIRELPVYDIIHSPFHVHSNYILLLETEMSYLGTCDIHCPV
jgi:hypothetical protein